jgi:bacterioferritin-associated ferredoxin
MYVCICLAVTAAEIEGAIEQGAKSTKKVGESCGAGTSCGKCKNTVRRIIEAKQESRSRR